MMQLALKLNTWGGRRPGAGRPASACAGASHLRRPALASRYPLHVTLTVLPRVPNLREEGRLRVLEGAFADGCERFGLRLIHYSVQTNHIHLIVEAADRRALARGIKGLSVRIAKRLNKKLGTKGQVIADRYHARVLKTPREIRNALAYVLENAAKHSGSPRRAAMDPCSSGRHFDGWKEKPPSLVRAAPVRVPVVAPRSWLLRLGWRRHGLI